MLNKHMSMRTRLRPLFVRALPFGQRQRESLKDEATGVPFPSGPTRSPGQRFPLGGKCDDRAGR
eukprot:19348-Lingulodinium_polyedra.AAC.1